jgi:hypothetical protein
MTDVNETLSAISTTSTTYLDNWNTPQDALRLKCRNNFDLPTVSKYIWLYYHNPKTNTDEVWNKFDSDKNDDIYQIFTNSATNENASLSSFLKKILTNEISSIKLQCAIYFDRYLTYDHSLSERKNLTIINSN